jgi:hypothetical protein
VTDLQHNRGKQQRQKAQALKKHFRSGDDVSLMEIQKMISLEKEKEGYSVEREIVEDRIKKTNERMSTANSHMQP